MEELNITRSCMIDYDANGKAHIVELEDIPPAESPFKGMNLGPSPEAIERCRLLWEEHLRMSGQTEGDAA